MAERKLTGKEVGLFIDPSGGTNYNTVVCLTTVSFSSETNIIDANSKCGEDKLAGTQEETIEFEGQHLIDPLTGKISGASLYTLKQNQTTIGWKIGELYPKSSSVVKSGQGFISAISEEYGLEDPATFSGTLTIKGLATQTIES